MYSQENEEINILLALDGHHGDKRFLDIGAGDPFDKSNTRALFELGWSGVLIEPAPRYMEALLLEYKFEPRIELVQAVVSPFPGLLLMQVSEQPSSTITEPLPVRDDVTYYGHMLVPALTPGDISMKFGGFDFVNIDAEGVSGDVFLRMLALDWEPRCFCVEHDERTTELLKAATAKGYHCTYMNGTNLVLVKS